MIPAEVMQDCRAHAGEVLAQGKPVNWIAATAIILIWLLIITTVGLAVWKAVK